MHFDPVAVLPGVWTLDSLRQLLQNTQRKDGWDEQAVYHFEVGGIAYEGEFVYGLLMRWRALESVAVGEKATAS